MSIYRLRKADLSNDCIRIFELTKFCRERKILPYQIDFVSEDEVRNWLSRQLMGYIHDFYVIEKSNDANMVHGIIFTFDYREYDRHCKIYGFLDEGMNREILDHFIISIFREYSLKKIFLELTDLEHEMLAAAENIGFKKEATLREYKYVCGAYHDLFILSIYPEKRGSYCDR